MGNMKKSEYEIGDKIMMIDVHSCELDDFLYDGMVFTVCDRLHLGKDGHTSVYPEDRIDLIWITNSDQKYVFYTFPECIRHLSPLEEALE